jgi:radical SAM superfamily enzyme YgiQ (UPF0313 family)
MKIACVFMPWYRRESPPPEFGLLIALVRKSGHRAFVFDINNGIFSQEFSKRSYWKYFLLDAPPEETEAFFQETQETFQDYCRQIIAKDPQLIIFKPIAKTYDNALRVAQILKKQNPDKLIIFSGKYTVKQQDIASAINQQEYSPFDFIICGQDELALPALLAAIEKNDLTDFDRGFKRQGKVIDCIDGPVLEDFDELPFFDFSDFDLNAYKRPGKIELFMSRGCPWRCSFCLSCLVENKYRCLSGRRLLQEILYQLNFHKGIKSIQFCDNTINGDINKLRDFCQLLAKEYKKGLPRLEWSGDAMIRQEMDAELLLQMSQAGCVGIGYGLESGSQKVVKEMLKPFSIPVAEKVFRDTHGAAIKTSVNILVGFPTETRADFEETLGFIERNKVNIDEIRLTFNGCRLYSESYLYKNYEKFGIIAPDTDAWTSDSGRNNYAERVKRAEEVCRLVLSLGMELMFNSRAKRKLDLVNT